MSVLNCTVSRCPRVSRWIALGPRTKKPHIGYCEEHYWEWAVTQHIASQSNWIHIMDYLARP